MGTGPKIAIGLLGAVLLLILVVPILAGIKKGAGGGGGLGSGPPPPYWNTSNLPGTGWEVNSPQGIVTVTFQAGGVAQAAHPIAQQFLGQPYLQGNWNISGDKLNISASVPPPINRNISFSVNIEGEELVGEMDGQRMSARRVR